MITTPSTPAVLQQNGCRVKKYEGVALVQTTATTAAVQKKHLQGSVIRSNAVKKSESKFLHNHDKLEQPLLKLVAFKGGSTN